MPIRLDYRLSRDASDLGFEDADELSLRYYDFPSDVTFVIDDADFSPPWDVPILDWALVVRYAAREAVLGEPTSIDFTESEREIAIQPSGESGEVVITSGYAPGSATVSTQLFAEEADRFLLRVVSDLIERYPSLEHNAFVANLRVEIEAERNA